MFGRKNRESVGTLKVAMSLLLLVAAGLFVLSFASTTFAGEMSKLSLKGEVVAINPDTKTLFVKSDDAMKGEFSFTLDDKAKITACDEIKAFGDLKVGDHITVTYYEREGKSIADSIALPSDKC
jgi:hypothetical protein